MLNMFMLMIIIMTILLFMMIIVVLISKKSFMDWEKSSPFECGFDPFNGSSWITFFFFLMAVIFLIFDVEIVFILPVFIIMKYSILLEWMMSSLLFMLILILWLYHEWIESMLEWAK